VTVCFELDESIKAFIGFCLRPCRGTDEDAFADEVDPDSVSEDFEPTCARYSGWRHRSDRGALMSLAPYPFVAVGLTLDWLFP
jgi:hypothetical protein